MGLVVHQTAHAPAQIAARIRELERRIDQTILVRGRLIVPDEAARAAIGGLAGRPKDEAGTR